MTTTTEMSGKPIAALSGAGLPWDPHEACLAWPQMSQLELRDLADDIAAHGLRDPITLTPDNLLLDGRNRALACAMAGIEPATVIYDGDPWLFSLSRNKHRRHMTEAAIALVAAALATKPLGANQHQGAYKKVPSIKEAAKASGIPKSAVEAAKVVLNSGTTEEVASVRSGKKKLTPTANAIRSRTRGTTTDHASAKKASSPVDPIDVVASEIDAKCSDGKWKSISKIATAVKVAPNAAKEALKILGPERVETRPNGIEIEYRITRDDETDMRRLLAAKDAEIADLKKRIAEHELEIERLTDRLTAPNVSTPPARKKQRAKPKPDIADSINVSVN
jgi:hypothetical protein